MTMENEQDSKSPAIPPLPPATGSASVGKRYSTVDELVADTCSPEVMREYVRLTAPPKALMDALRMQVHQLEMTMLCGGPSEICGAIDAVESALHELRELVTPNDKHSNRGSEI